MTSKAHYLLRTCARSILEKQGFRVQIEKRIKHPPIPYVHKLGRWIDSPYFQVDVYGEKDGEIVIYEVGYCEPERLEWLRKNIGKTIHMPYIIPWCENRYPRRYYGNIPYHIIRPERKKLRPNPQLRFVQTHLTDLFGCGSY